MFETGLVKKNENHIMNIGAIYIQWEGRLHRTRSQLNDEFVITLSKSKRGAHHIDMREHVMRGYQLHIVFPGQQSHFSILDHTVTYQLRITKRNFEKVCFSLRFSLYVYKKYPIQPLTELEFGKLLYELENIGNELHMHRPLLEIICSRTRITLQEISRILERKISDIHSLTIPSVLFNFIQLLELHYNKERTVAFYAQKLNVTSNYLAKLTRLHLQTTPINIIRDHVLTESMRRLSLVPITIKAVMFELGFEDQVAFTHFFKKASGMSPGDFQKSTLGF
jgi:AraC-like DNA-binding protein